MEENIRVSKARPLTLLLVLSLGFVMAVLDTTGVVLAVPEIKQFLTVSISDSIWVINAYTLALGTFLLLAGNLASKFGARKMLITGMLLFVSASFGCSLAGNIDLLIGLRFVQGLRAALFMPSSMSILYKAFAETGELPKMLGIYTSIISVATGTGSFIGGTLIQYFGWKSVFLINVPIGIVTMLYILVNVKPDTAITSTKIDVVSNALLVLTVASVIVFLVEGNQFGYGRPGILAFLVAAIVFAGLFGIRLRFSQAPIIPWVLLKQPEFTVTNIVGFLMNVSLYGIILVLGLYFQEALGLSSMIAGLLILSGMAVLIFGNLFYAKYSMTLGPKRLIIAGAFLSLVGAALMAISSLVLKPVPLWLIIVTFAIMSVAIGVVVPASTTLLMEAAGNQYSSIAGATLNANKQIGGLFGTAITGIIISSLTSNWIGIVQTTFMFNVGLYAVAFVLLGYFLLSSRKGKAAK